MFGKTIATKSFETLSALFDQAHSAVLHPKEKLIVVSDIHMGDGGPGDDIVHNGPLLKKIVAEYYQRQQNYSGSILIGDIYELLKFSLKKAKKTWADLDRTLHDFPTVYHLEGNHDILKEQRFPNNVYPALTLTLSDDTAPKDALPLFFFHGHQVDPINSGWLHSIDKIFLRIVGFLGIHNSSTKFGTPNKMAIEQAIYDFSQNKKIISIIGHTHRPLFESMNKGQYLYKQLEKYWELYQQAVHNGETALAEKYQAIGQRLNSRYANYQAKQQAKKDQTAVYSKAFPDPRLFNTGCTIAKDGMTMIELSYDRIALVYWTSKKNEEYDNGELILLDDTRTPCYRYVLREAPLSEIFERISFLG